MVIFEVGNWPGYGELRESLMVFLMDNGKKSRRTFSGVAFQIDKKYKAKHDI